MPEFTTSEAGRPATIRQQLQHELENGVMSCRDLSRATHQSEKEVLEHLRHLQLSLRQQAKTLKVEPSVCRKCNYVFEQRSRLTKPGKCPACRHTTIDPPLFSIADR